MIGRSCWAPEGDGLSGAQSALHRQARQLHPRGDANLVEDVLQMGPHRVGGKVQALRDLAVGEALGDEAYDAELGAADGLPAQLGPSGRSTPLHRRTDSGASEAAAHACLVPHRTDVVERLEGLVEVPRAVRVGFPGEECPAGVFEGGCSSDDPRAVTELLCGTDQPLCVPAGKPPTVGGGGGEGAEPGVEPGKLVGGSDDDPGPTRVAGALGQADELGCERRVA